ncbi:DUF6906 family protein [Cytobacillus purgationiresistens]|uniref:DUF6906 domain-containing protein n=1 Tax=Cytobacillus purgationiresistens TaxID=863449 RepID=A0ABU0AHR5_9BACI|nr:hypothetical protein [Cytobacillus purgationiresistens]MDQ0269973.1 hypothetical protein [Cytobacillus purgationiresistens]
MKNGKNPTVKQKKIIQSSGLNRENWLVVKNLPEKLVIVHRNTNQTKSINHGGY